MLNLVAVATLALLAGCQDRLYNSAFEATGETTFKYRGTAAADQPLESQDGERTRITQMEGWLRDNSMCPGGYVITSRIPTKKSSALLGDVYDVNYSGRCADGRQ